VAAAALAFVATIGAIYEWRGERRDAQRLPRVGRAVPVDGRTMNIFCSGEGSPSVVFDAGAGESGYVWADIQARIAELTRACWFDRAGYGWSDPGPFPRTSAAMSHELHELLASARVPPPYVLVGHSLGGLNARVYTSMYPADVAGLVLVDAAHEDEPRRAPKFMLGRTAPRWLWHPIWTAAQVGRVLGLIRLVTPRAQLSELPAERTRLQIIAALRRQPKTIATLADATTPESYAEAAASGGLGDRPLIVLTRGRGPAVADTTEIGREYAAYLQVWMHEIQPKLARLSTRGRQIIVEKSGHDIPDEAPDAVIAAVSEVVTEVRSEKAAAGATPGQAR
jgi:pimeloyl-ACP methyl ester carboxylesterase